MVEKHIASQPIVKLKSIVSTQLYFHQKVNVLSSVARDWGILADGIAIDWPFWTFELPPVGAVCCLQTVRISL